MRVRGSAEAGKRFVFNPPGTGWTVVSDGGLDYACNEKQEGTCSYSVKTDKPGKHVFILENRNPADGDGIFELDLFVHPRGEPMYAYAWEGFLLRVPLWEESGGGWEILDDGGIDCRTESDEKPVLVLRGGPPGKYRIILSCPEGCRVLNLDVRPVNYRASLKTAAGKPAEYSIDANITTGFEWVIAESEGLQSSTAYVPDPNPRMLDGTGGRQVFRMSAESPGIYILRAVCIRSPDECGGALELELTVS